MKLREPSREEMELRDRFAKAAEQACLSAAPEVFRWLEWVGVLAVIRFCARPDVARMIGSGAGLALNTIYWILMLLCWLYFITKFNLPVTPGLNNAQLFNRRIFFSILLGFVTTAAMMLAVGWLAAAIASVVYRV